MSLDNIAKLPPAKRKRVPKDPGDGWRPDENPWLCRLILDRWDAEIGEPNENRPQAADTPFRNSDLGKCSRMLALKLAGAPRERATVGGRFRMHIGTLVHDMIQALVDGEHEVKSILADLTSGHADTVLTLDGEQVLVELKTVGGWGYKSQCTTMGGPPKGPKLPHVLQAGANAEAQGIDRIILVYISLENVGKDKGWAIIGPEEIGQVMSQFTLEPEVWRPLLEAERVRLAGILDDHDAGYLSAARPIDWDIPAEALVYDSENGGKKGEQGKWRAVDDDGNVAGFGDYWECAYCDYRPVCENPGMPVTLNQVRGGERR